jgi:hypothetical protein
LHYLDGRTVVITVDEDGDLTSISEIASYVD